MQKANENNQISGREKSNQRTYTVEEVMDILNIGRNSAYALVQSGVFHYVKVGGHYRISKKSFDNWLDGKGGKTDHGIC